MKKYLFLALAALGLVACVDNESDNNSPVHSGEIEESYIAINLSASGTTRAKTGYDDGTEAERAVSHADFFFFDKNGDPFPVNVTEGPATAPGVADGRNHLRATGIKFGVDADNDDDISDSSDAVLLLKTYKGEYPSQIVAVLNWSPNTTPYTLESLYDDVQTSVQQKFSGTDYFVMSNAVFAQNGKAVYATPLTIDNIYTPAEGESDEQILANAKPVIIYVERVAAKVTVKSGNTITDSEFDINETVGDKKVYAKILGWDLYNDNPNSRLLKKIDASWDNTTLGFTWNDEPWYRSFWAESLDLPTDNSMPTTYAFADGASTYIGENTTGKATCTKVIIKAQLQDENDNSLEIALWNNVEYVTELNLRTAVANTLVNTYYAKSDAGVYTGLKAEDLQCVAGGATGAPAGVAANEVYFQISEASKGKDWYKYVNGVFQPLSPDFNGEDPHGLAAINANLKNVPSAVLYEGGETLYYVDIRHLANALDKDGSYGIVRNHSYNLAINSIKGYGSPVYTGSQFIEEYPTTPDQQTYVSAKINILSWRLVSQEVNITPGN